jgi:hypothetical protein
VCSIGLRVCVISMVQTVQNAFTPFFVTKINIFEKRERVQTPLHLRYKCCFSHESDGTKLVHPFFDVFWVNYLMLFWGLFLVGYFSDFIPPPKVPFLVLYFWDDLVLSFDL